MTPDGERVTTGSEPKRVRDAIIDRGLPRVAAGETEADALVRYADEIADRFEVVGSGHDEQTEEPPREFLLRVIDALVVERDVVRERTVAAVVGALRDRVDGYADRSPDQEATLRCADFIENHPRFKPSAPGGGNA